VNKDVKYHISVFNLKKALPCAELRRLMY